MSYITIRDRVFETNSSSSHSLTISSDEMGGPLISGEAARAGVIRIFPGDYGWEFYRYYGLEGKLAYLYTQLCMRDGVRDAIEEAEAVAEPLTPRYTAEIRRQCPAADRLCAVAETLTGCEVLLHGFSDDGYYGIDHQSVGVGLDLTDEGREEDLAALLGNPGSYIETGNDNDHPPEMIKTDRGPVESFAASVVAAKPRGADAISVALSSPYASVSSAIVVNGAPAELTAEQELDLLSHIVANDVAVVPSDEDRNLFGDGGDYWVREARAVLAKNGMRWRRGTEFRVLGSMDRDIAKGLGKCTSPPVLINGWIAYADLARAMGWGATIRVTTRAGSPEPPA